MLTVANDDYKQGYMDCLNDMDEAFAKCLNAFPNTFVGLSHAVNAYIDTLIDTRQALNPPSEQVTMDDLLAMVSKLAGNGYVEQHGKMIVVINK